MSAETSSMGKRSSTPQAPAHVHAHTWTPQRRLAAEYGHDVGERSDDVGVRRAAPPRQAHKWTARAVEHHRQRRFAHTTTSTPLQTMFVTRTAVSRTAFRASARRVGGARVPARLQSSSVGQASSNAPANVASGLAGGAVVLLGGVSISEGAGFRLTGDPQYTATITSREQRTSSKQRRLQMNSSQKPRTPSSRTPRRTRARLSSSSARLQSPTRV